MFDYEYQWQMILNDNIFTEEAVITDDDTMYFKVKGVYYSGPHDEDSPAPYAPKATVGVYGFQCSSREMPEGLKDPEVDLNGATLLLPGRNRRFRIQSVLGNDGGMYTFRLQPRKEEELDG